MHTPQSLFRLPLLTVVALGLACAPPLPTEDAGPEPEADAGPDEASGMWFLVETPVYPFDLLEVLFGNPLGEGVPHDVGQQYCRVREIAPPTRAFADRETEVRCKGIVRPDGYLSPFTFGVPVESVSRTWWVGDSALEWEYGRTLSFASGDEVETQVITSGDPSVHRVVAAGIEQEVEFRNSIVMSGLISPVFLAAFVRIAIAAEGGRIEFYGSESRGEVSLNVIETTRSSATLADGTQLIIDPDDGELVEATSANFHVVRLDGPPEDTTLPAQMPTADPTETVTPRSLPGPATREQLTATGFDGLELGCDLYVPDAATFDVLVMLHPSGRYSRNFEDFIEGGSTLNELGEDIAASGRGFLLCDKRPSLSNGREPLMSELVVDYTAEHAAIAADDRVQDVYLVGWSLGSMLAPQVAAEAGAAGAILLSACPQLFDAAIDMLGHAAEVCGYPEADLETMVSDLEDDYALVLAETFPSDERRFFNGFYALGDTDYWLDATSVDPIEDGLAHELPILVVQGEADTQCPTASYERYTTAWASRANTQLELIEGVDHLLRASHTGPLTKSFQFPRRMHAEVRGAITDWLDAR
jgi:pimeloyl-ACP methyl ester carboxylesterase